MHFSYIHVVIIVVPCEARVHDLVYVKVVFLFDIMLMWFGLVRFLKCLDGMH